MTTTDLTTTTQHIPQIEIVPATSTGNRRSRLTEFAGWLDRTGQPWTNPDLAAYQQYLLTRDEQREVQTRTGRTVERHYGPVAAESIKTYVATVRGRYKELAEDNETRDALYAMAGAELARTGRTDDPVNRKTIVDEILTRLANAVRANGHDIKPVTRQDRTDEEVGLRLTRGQADALLASPGLIPIDKLRDTTILAVLLCTGLREQELVDLEVRDLRQTVDRALCVQVRSGKGKKARCVPWGEGQWALVYVDKWLTRAGIAGGPVFRGFYKPRNDGTRRLRRGKLSTRAIQMIVASYPVMVDGQRVTVHPHDLRRTYARRNHDGGMPTLAISQNLGHASEQTTLLYIGACDVDSRKPPALYTPPHWVELDRLDAQGSLALEDR